MTACYDWREPTTVRDEAQGSTFVDPLTGKKLVVPTADEKALWQALGDRLQRLGAVDARALADDIHDALSRTDVGRLPSVRLEGARVVDRAFLAVAIAVSLEGDAPADRLASLRVAALGDEFQGAAHDAWRAHLDRLKIQLDDVSLALQTASTALVFENGQWRPGKSNKAKPDSFKTHPLHGKGKVGIVSGGAQQIKSYFMESARLPEIRGASVLLDYVNGRLTGIFNSRDGLFPVPECAVFAAGGNFLALVPPDLVDRVADEVEKLYAENTLTARAAAAGAAFTLTELQYGLSPEVAWGSGDKGFGELTAYVNQLVQERRQGCASSSRQPLRQYQHDAPPFAARCASCGHRPACCETGEWRDLSAAGLCESCARKALVGRFAKKETVGARYHDVARDIGWTPAKLDIESWPSQFDAFLDAHPALRDRYLEHRRTVVPADDVGDVAGAERHIGVLYADGNNIGARLEKMRTAAEFRQFAQRLHDTTRDSVFRALAETLRPNEVDLDNGGKAHVHPFEILSIGGDDVFLVVPASKALELASRIAGHFDVGFDREAPLVAESARRHRYRGQLPADRRYASSPCITLACGVVIAGSSTPIRYMRGLAEELLKSAKKTSRKHDGSAIDFHVMKSQGNVLDSLAEFRASMLENRDHKTRLTARPYLAAEIDGLLHTASRMKQANVPPSQLYGLRRALARGRESGRLEFMYAWARSREGGQAQLFEALATWQKQNGPPDPWIEGEDRFSETLIPDLLELLPFVPRPVAVEEGAVSYASR